MSVCECVFVCFHELYTVNVFGFGTWRRMWAWAYRPSLWGGAPTENMLSQEVRRQAGVNPLCVCVCVCVWEGQRERKHMCQQERDFNERSNNIYSVCVSDVIYCKMEFLINSWGWFDGYCSCLCWLDQLSVRYQWWCQEWKRRRQRTGQTEVESCRLCASCNVETKHVLVCGSFLQSVWTVPASLTWAADFMQLNPR